MHYCGIPTHTQSVVGQKVLTEHFWEIQLKIANVNNTLPYLHADGVFILYICSFVRVICWRWLVHTQGGYRWGHSQDRGTDTWLTQWTIRTCKHFCEVYHLLENLKFKNESILDAKCFMHIVWHNTLNFWCQVVSYLCDVGIVVSLWQKPFLVTPDR